MHFYAVSKKLLETCDTHTVDCNVLAASLIVKQNLIVPAEL